METLGRGRRTCGLLMFCKVVETLQGGERSWPGSEQPEGMEGELRRVQMRRGPAFPKELRDLVCVFQSLSGCSS